MHSRFASIIVLIVVAMMASGGIWGAASLMREPSAHIQGSTARLVAPSSAQVAAAEARRLSPSARVRAILLTAAPASIDLGDRTVTTWAFNGRLPGPTLRLNAGDLVRAEVVNHLPADLTVHWHGIALRNDMDGVPDLTQRPVRPGERFTYEFTAPDPGTYFYHPHSGTQLDRGLYGAVVVADPTSPAASTDIPLLLDDWIDGTGQTPDAVLNILMGGMNTMNMYGSEVTSRSPRSPLGPDISDVRYPFFVVNGRDAESPRIYPVDRGERVRLRLINAASATPFRVAFGGGRMTVIASDGFPVQPVRTDALLIGMGERYDVEVTIPRNGAFPVVAQAEGRRQEATVVLRAGVRTVQPDARPATLDGHLLTLDELDATPAVSLPRKPVDLTYHVRLTGSMMGFDWGITAPMQRGTSLPVRTGQRVRLVIRNETAMWHPIHLHGHTFQVVGRNGSGPRKDTVVVGARSELTVEFTADNPGQWMLHCHNVYHSEAGMMTTLNYLD